MTAISTSASTRSRTQARLDALIAEGGPIEWDRPLSAQPRIADIFDRLLAEDGLLGCAVGQLQDRLEGCESYPGMDKLVLWQSQDGALRLRLHLFSPGYTDRPHNHRWSFATRVLAGTYLHTVYGSGREVLSRGEQGIAPAPLHVHEVSAGAGYFLDHELVHSLATETHTVSLVLRGPSTRPDYFTWEPAAGEVVWSLGAVRETADQRRDKAMSASGYARTVRLLSETGVL